MKKSLLLIPILILSCKKEAKMTTVQDKDSTVVTEMPDSAVKTDSALLKNNDSVINETPATPENSRKGAVREEKDGQIIRTMDTPGQSFTLSEEFTKDNQELVMKLRNFEKSKLKATITTNQKDFNIRFNQIRLPNGDYDGPFGREITYKIPEKGEVWLIIGKSNMASGNTKGKFTVSVE